MPASVHNRPNLGFRDMSSLDPVLLGGADEALPHLWEGVVGQESRRNWPGFTCRRMGSPN